MNVIQTTTNVGSRIASVLNFTNSNTSVAKKAVNPVYYVEDCQISGDGINVDYTFNDEWLDTVVSMAALRLFTVTVGLNDYCFDHCINGEHQQDAGSLNLDTFIAENLNACVKAYLVAKKVGQNVN